MAQIKVNVQGHASDVPPSETTDADGATNEVLAVPNTGVISNSETGFTSSTTTCAMLIGLAVLIAGVVVALLKNRKKTIFASGHGMDISHGKGWMLGIFGIAVVMGTVGVIAIKSANEVEITNAVSENSRLPSDEHRTLSVSASDINIDLVVDGEAAFAYAKSDVRITTGTNFGYTLGVYSSSADLMAEDGSNNKISGVENTSEEGVALNANTWGFSTVLPTDQNSQVWHGLSTDIDDIAIVKSTDLANSEDEVVPVYYGVYATPELPSGSYSGTTINYVAVANVVAPTFTVNYDGNGAFFDEAQTQSINTVGYAKSCAIERAHVGNNYELIHSDNLDDDGNRIRDFGELESDYVRKGVAFEGAVKMKVVIEYGLHVPAALYTDSPESMSGLYKSINNVGREEIVLDGSSLLVDFRMNNNNLSTSPRTGDDNRYGYYIKVYPVYETEQADTSYSELPKVCRWANAHGHYMDPIFAQGESLMGWIMHGWFVTSEKYFLKYMEPYLDAESEIEGDVYTFTAVRHQRSSSEV